jgi:endonuclease VIII
MPEGPSIVLLKEQIQQFKGKKVVSVSGNSKIDLQRMEGKKVTDFKSWGKHFLICFKGFTVRVHFLLFGSYRINEERDKPPRVSLTFDNGFLNLYATSVRYIDEDPDDIYDWSADVMSDSWDSKKASRKLLKMPDRMVCDVLLDQNIFSGVGNIIKNEVLYRIHVHPASLIGSLPAKQKRLLIAEARNYSFDFLEWKRNYVLKKHWLAHTKRICKRCELPITKEYLGVTNRRTFFCEGCQVEYK